VEKGEAKVKFRIAAILSISLLSGLSAQAGAVALLTPIQFAPETDKRAEVRDECKLGEQLQTQIGDALAKTYHSDGTTTSTQGDVVRVTVKDIWGARGNNWTGPKGMFIQVELLHDGKVQRSEEMHRTTMGGFFGAFKGICGFMERDAVALGKDVARWSGDPSYKPDGNAASAKSKAASE
jgi:hypothetical protein